MSAMCVFGERSIEEVAVLLGVADGEREVRLPRLGQPVHEREEVVRAEHVHGGPPQLRVPRGERERHVAAVGAPDHACSRDVDALVLRQDLRHRVDVVEPVEPAPVAIDLLRVLEAVAGRAARVRNEDREALEGEDLDQRYREPREVRTLLALRPAVDVVHERPRALVSELGRREVETRRDAQAVVRLERRVLAGREELGSQA